MNLESLNEMVQYIEDNLEEKIEISELANMTNMNQFILERIFMFLTDMTIVEYIKKRRLSRAFEEIRNTDSKIIDVALKYRYNSAASFSRAFKQMFDITPSECRRGVGDYKIVPREYFEVSKKKYNLDYQISEIETMDLYCYHVSSRNYSDYLYKIRKLYDDIQGTDRYRSFNDAGMYGVFFQKDGVYHYYLGSKIHFADLEKYTLEHKKYAVFKLSSRKQGDIVEIEKKINYQWIPSTGYGVMSDMKIEYYEGECCHIYLPIDRF